MYAVMFAVDVMSHSSNVIYIFNRYHHSLTEVWA